MRTQAPTYLRKEQIERRDVYLPSTGELVRFAVATEEALAAPPPGQGGPADPPRIQRWKTRHSFNHKHEVLYDLTEVRAGASEAQAAASPPEFEVELEWIGAQPRRQQQQQQQQLPPDFCAKKFVLKVADLVLLRREGAKRGFAESASRPGGAMASGAYR